ncbi:MAG: exodeoxyribonuclease VII small subunit [Steroidobacteraceae bacterium]|jgi:exodeoxyribonuclease VII small subunit|nr:exodeoxyribonuclease VII small subunit [Gammaproteobacteria bacterium]
MTRNKRAPDFEKSITELESLVEKLEGGDLSLEESLKAFERGVRLTRECQGALEAAETKVEILLQQAGGESLQAFDDELEEADE